MNQGNKAVLFGDLHVKGDPVVLYNIWDAGSAKSVEACGARAIATGSWSVAAAHGFDDGEALPFDALVTTTSCIASSVSLPVTIDFESGYATSTNDIAQNARALFSAGAVGLNFEDQVIGDKGLYAIDIQSQRIKAIRQEATRFGIPAFVNARTDLFLQNERTHHERYVNEAIERAAAYRESGATGFFVPGLCSGELIARICEAVSLPVNIMVTGSMPSHQQLAEYGVARISYGPSPYIKATRSLKTAAKRVYSVEPGA